MLPATKALSDALRAKHPQSLRRISNASNLPLQSPKSQRSHRMRCCGQFAHSNRVQPRRVRPSTISHRRAAKDTCLFVSRGMLGFITELVHLLAFGRAPLAIAAWIAGAPLTRLAKKDMSPRSTAVGATLPRLVSSCLANRVNGRAAAYFQPLQVGIATKSGTGIVVHGVRRTVNKFGTNSDYALLYVDLKNAFNICSRPSSSTPFGISFPSCCPG